MHLFGRFYAKLEDALNENEEFFVKHPFDINEPATLNSIEYKGKHFIAINRKDGQIFYARPFICVHGDKEPLLLSLNGVGPDLRVSFKEAEDIESIEVPVYEKFADKIQIRFNNYTNIMCNSIEILK